MDRSILDIYWMLVAAMLVFLMQPGFLCLESGLTRSKNNIGVAVKNLSDFVLSVFSFWAVGYGLMYGPTVGGQTAGGQIAIGQIAGGQFPSGWLSRTPLPPDLGADGGLAAFFFFQAMFCGTATTIFSGAVAERMRFGAYMAAAFLLAVFIYPIFGHWAWNGLETGRMTGWLGRLGFVDFAGSTVVHGVGGWVALAALLIIGPRRGRFPADGPPREINPSNLPLSLLGAMLLWVGWFGFNGGSALAMDDRVPNIIVNTLLSGTAGAMACLGWGWYRAGVPKVVYLINGSIGGLVAVTANCHCVSAGESILIGGVGGFVYMGCDRLLIRLRIDDAVGAVPAHLGCGIWGTLAVALFGDPVILGTGLGLAGQLGVQAAGIAAAFGLAFGLSYSALSGIDRIFPLRVSEEAERIGLNLSEHGARGDMLDLFEAMDRQAEARDLSMRLPEEPFTEAGRIARRHNAVMEVLERSVAQTEAIFRTARDAIIAFGRDNFRILRANPSALAMFGYEVDRMRGLSAAALFADGRVGEGLLVSGGAGMGAGAEIAGRRQNGEVFPMEAVISEAVAGSRAFFVGTFRDLTERKRARAVIHQQRAYFRQLFEGSPEAIAMLDPEGRIRSVNNAYERLFGYPEDAIRGRRNRDLVVPEDRHAEVAAFNQVILSGHSIHKETARRHQNGREIPVALLGYPIVIDGCTEGIFYIYRDISERKAFETQLHEKAFYDFLTGIPNRILFMERLDRALDRALTRRRRPEVVPFAVLLADLDRFKWVNDSLGHMAGDHLIMEISRRFGECLGPMDTVARMGGDEFAVLVEEYESPRDVLRLARRLQDAAQIPFSIDGHEVRVSCSIGVVLKTEAYENAQNILRDADIAMYRAKEQGKARFKVFNQKMHELTLEKMTLESELREAIAAGQLALYYQPIVSVASGRLIGFEALCRWIHPQQGVISPVKFIPIAEETGLILPLGRWVIERACRDLMHWRRSVAGADRLSMAVNISARQFLQKDLGDFIVETLTRFDLPPECLRVELTETVVMGHAGTAIEQLRRLKQIGVKVAIDDFGTGYSSLSYLRRFPIDWLKIDKSFVDGLGLVEDSTEIVRMILSLARNLRIGVVAEGVERPEQLEQLRQMACDSAQGYLFSKPVPRAEVEAIFERYL